MNILIVKVMVLSDWCRINKFACIPEIPLTPLLILQSSLASDLKLPTVKCVMMRGKHILGPEQVRFILKGDSAQKSSTMFV